MGKRGGMHPVESLMDYGRLMSLLDSLVTPLSRTAWVRVPEASGSRSAARILARIEIPRFFRAAFDGYAVAARRTETATPETPALFRVVGTSKPGQPFRKRIREDEAVKIFTGSELPSGADSVAIVEHTELEGNTLKVMKAFRTHEYLDLPGSDTRKGDELISTGSLIKPSDVALLASQGYSRIKVYDTPKVYIVSTGNEIRTSGRLRRGEFYDSNTPSVAALLREFGVQVRGRVHVPDNIDVITRRLDALSKMADVVVFIAGSSAGGEDYVPASVGTLGRVLVRGVAMSPGRPTLVGKVRDAWVVGLPGNPASCFTVAHFVLVPLLSRLMGVTLAHVGTQATLAEEMNFPDELTYFRTVGVRAGEVYPVYKGSSAVTSFRGAHGFVGIRGPCVLKKGERVNVSLVSPVVKLPNGVLSIEDVTAKVV
jgi:molybdopterin molybdotransferase